MSMPKRTLAIDKPIADKLFQLAVDLEVSGQSLATKAVAFFLASAEANPIEIERLKLKAEAEHLMERVGRIDVKLMAIEARLAAPPKGKRRKKGQHRPSAPLYNGKPMLLPSRTESHA
jgi:hypothetical protein